MKPFFESLFGNAICPRRRLLIFTLPDRQALHFWSVEPAARYATAAAEAQDVYFQVGLAGTRFGMRNAAADIIAIPGLWADIDLLAPWRADRSLPATVEEAFTLISRLPFSPSVLVDSGYGLHAYWLFKEPWVFETDDERREAARYAKGWVDTIRTAAHGPGWEVDSVGELARILRPPGTLNHKGDQPVEVRTIEMNDRRYNPCDFEDFAADVTASDPTHTGDLVLRPDAEPPAEKFAALLAAAPAFAQAWNRQRFDLLDQSQSAYDLSLADMAALNGWTDQEIASLIVAARRKHGEKPEKALRADYVSKTIASARRAAEERTAEGVDLSGFMIDARPTSGPTPLRRLVDLHPNLRDPVIEGLLREGETMNIIAPSKTGKSWLVIDLALAIATGRPWLGMGCVPGDVLIIDNELHSATSANRIPKVAVARGIAFDEFADRLYVENVRGHLQDLVALGPYFDQFAPGQFKVVILDAFYRFLPMRADENDNGTMANLYNYLDAFANRLNCCFVLIHHTSKGNQSLKAVTDVGAGAGAQSRATDTHLILRRHEEEDVVVLDAAVRSWPPVPPRCLRWAFPVWMPADDLDPAALRQEGGRRKAKDAEEPAPVWDVESFVTAFVGREPRSQARILDEAERAGVSSRRVKRFTEMAEEDRLIHRHKVGPYRVPGYATVPAPEDDPQDSSKRAEVEALLRDEPTLTTREVAGRCGVSRQYVNRIRRGVG